MEAETKQAAPTTLNEICDKILSLIATYPEACSRAVRRMTASQEGLQRLAIAFGAIGYEYSRQLFPWITDLQWFMMESHAARSTHLDDRSAKEPGRVLLSVFTDLLAETMEDTETYATGPFDFLIDMDAEKLAGLFIGESASAIALVAVFWAPAEMSRILKVLPEATRIQTILRIARLQRIPDEQARVASERFAKQLRSKQQIPLPPPPPIRAPGFAPGPATAPEALTPAVKPAPPRRAAAIPPPPPVPRLRRSDENASPDFEEVLLSCIRSESPDLYVELARGDYFRAIEN